MGKDFWWGCYLLCLMLLSSDRGTVKLKRCVVAAAKLGMKHFQTFQSVLL